MHIDATGHINLDLALPIASTKEAADLRKTTNEKFPFLEYAVNNVLHHAKITEREGVEQSIFIENFTLQTWIKFNNLLEQREIRRYSQNASLLYVSAEKNLLNLIRAQPKKDLMLNIKKERYRYLLVAALTNGNKGAVKSILMMCPNVRFDSAAPPNFDLDLGRDLNAHRGSLRGASPKNRQSLLGYLAEHGIVSVVKLLLDNGLDINGDDQNSRIPLWWAARNRYEEMIVLLLDKGAKVDKMAGREALWCVVGSGHEKTVALLLSKEAEIESKDKDGRTPLSWAVGNGHEKIVALLLNKGAEIESNDRDGRTPLLWAAECGHEKIVALLLERGAKIDSKDYYGRTPLDRAAGIKHEGIVKLLDDWILNGGRGQPST